MDWRTITTPFGKGKLLCHKVRLASLDCLVELFSSKLSHFLHEVALRAGSERRHAVAVLSYIAVEWKMKQKYQELHCECSQQNRSLNHSLLDCRVLIHRHFLDY